MFTRSNLPGMAALICVIASANVLAARGHQGSYHSSVLGRVVNFTVYLPDGYSGTTGKYPAVYLLHGLDGNEMEAMSNGALSTLDAMLKRREIPPMLAIMPSFGKQSWWTDGARDQSETALMEELIPYVENRYRIASQRAARSLAGWSMGGYGALNLAMKYPARFCAAAAINPELHDPLPPATSAIRRTPQFMRQGVFDAAAWQALNYPARIDSYGKSTVRVPLWLAASDDDALPGMTLKVARLHARLLAIQPGQTELKIFGAERDDRWAALRDALPDALRYISLHCADRQPAPL